MKIPHLRWYIAALLFTATVINYVDRQALSILAPVLTKEMNLSPVQYAGILQGFLYAYTVMYPTNHITNRAAATTAPAAAGSHARAAGARCQRWAERPSTTAIPVAATNATYCSTTRHPM